MTTSRSRRISFALAFVALAGLLAGATPAEAQRRGAGRGQLRIGGRIGGPRIIVGGGFRSPGLRGGLGFGLRGSQWGPWGPYGPYGGYGAGPFYRDGRIFSASIRVEVDPKDAQVYVDGSLAGPVDDYDSWYQSLWVSAGDHEIAIFKEGYRTIRQQIYFEPGQAKHLKEAMVVLKSGESSGPRPEPRRDQAAAPGVPGRGDVRGLQPQGPPSPPTAPAAQERPARFGSLALRVQPEDAEVLVDGQPWKGSATERLGIRLPVGRHHIEVRKTGFQTYAEDVLIRTNATLTLNVALKK